MTKLTRPHGTNMTVTVEKLERIRQFCATSTDIFLPSFDVETSGWIDDDACLLMNTNDKKCPRILRIIENRCAESIAVIPYYRITQRPMAQITSFLIGRRLCNLADVQELFGALYSRCCKNHDPAHLPQQDPIESHIALWVHDCLTQDFDHHRKLNRQALAGGAHISYDFGLAFLSNCFPPFYTFELGLKDHLIALNKDFLIALLTGYAIETQTNEDTFIRRLMAAYPNTAAEDMGRYYFRNFKCYFAKRIYFGRFFEKLKSTPFCTDDLLALGDIIGLNVTSMPDWNALVRALSDMRFQHLDLKGLDLSGADLRKADLKKANLRHTNLKGANLEKADLRGADLTGANMENANVKGAITG